MTGLLLLPVKVTGVRTPEVFRQQYEGRSGRGAAGDRDGCLSHLGRLSRRLFP